ncbi:MAG: hypothetical protein MPN21_06570 [Thermoanaerobaculia bacterium]|nr:hypothetical protein [Thermoanaerobaculia bacterium]
MKRSIRACPWVFADTRQARISATRYLAGCRSSRFGIQFALATLMVFGTVGFSHGQAETAFAMVEPAFVVIVHADNPATSVDKDRLSKMFLKKIKRWQDSEAGVEAFDQLELSEVREAFTHSVHGKSVSAIKSYWQRMIFSGRDVPPEELESDLDVIEAVAEDEGGVGYVSSDAALSEGVKTILVTEK